MQVEDIHRIREQQEGRHEQDRLEQQHKQLLHVLNQAINKLESATSTNNSKLIKLANMACDLTDTNRSWDIWYCHCCSLDRQLQHNHSILTTCWPWEHHMITTWIVSKAVADVHIGWWPWPVNAWSVHYPSTNHMYHSRKNGWSTNWLAGDN